MTLVKQHTDTVGTLRTGTVMLSNGQRWDVVAEHGADRTIQTVKPWTERRVTHYWYWELERLIALASANGVFEAVHEPPQETHVT